MSSTVRQAREADYEDVVSVVEGVWDDRETDDYVPAVFDDWVHSDGPSQRTVVVEVDGTVVGLCQAALVSDHEAYVQGIRVDPAHRGAGYGLAMLGDLFEWASDRGATVARGMVFSWNDAGLGQAVAAGFRPESAFRWARPEPGEAEPSMPVERDPTAAWSYWTRSDGRTALSGVTLDTEQTWAVAELTRERLQRLADEQAVFAVAGSGTRGIACRVRTTEDAADRTLAEYAVGTWDDTDAADALFDAVRADAAELGVDGTRVFIPETPRHVAEAAYVRANTSDWPTFVLSADLTGT
ncbi:GNAT family N-acetyltransferase [Haloarcula sp. GH36]|uniref:GNAT family N-acetyltransferase n=1 Tax=Haloarcula montana TaxID=3111776 RepID=UPI002D79794A|nr:GNAT family N-acetyltransferase [Haloarcula sp. GH36]